jgi:hypothetical protein
MWQTSITGAEDIVQKTRFSVTQYANMTRSYVEAMLVFKKARLAKDHVYQGAVKSWICLKSGQSGNLETVQSVLSKLVIHGVLNLILLFANGSHPLLWLSFSIYLYFKAHLLALIFPNSSMLNTHSIFWLSVVLTLVQRRVQVNLGARLCMKWRG